MPLPVTMVPLTVRLRYCEKCKGKANRDRKPWLKTSCRGTWCCIFAKAELKLLDENLGLRLALTSVEEQTALLAFHALADCAEIIFHW